MDAYQSAKEEIKRAANIAELIGQYVQLRKAGQNYMGLCPFHSEKDPSFTVNPAKQIFHCFGCKKGGDIFTFWMEYHKVSFPRAMEDLAERYHVALPRKEPTASQKKERELNESLFEMNAMAADFFHHILNRTRQGLPGREYLEKRSLSKDLIDEFKIGYAPDGWDNLTRFMKDKGVDMEKAARAGLIIPKKGKGYYDRFRARVVFPIHTLRNQVAGFGGRVLDDTLPKYINSPESPIFQKGELLYGLHLAYPSIRESGRVVIVEGYTDVLALRGHGFHEAVATLGTALTKGHIRKLKGYVKEAIVVFDSDTAGKGAAIKSLPLFLNEGLSARVMVLPEGDDPDTFITRHGRKGFSKRLNGSVPLFEFFIDLKLSRADKGIEGQVNFLKEILPVLSDIHNDSLRSLYIRSLSEKSGIAESVVFSELRRLRAAQPGKGNGKDLRAKLASSRAEKLDDRHMLNLLVHFPHTVYRLKNSNCTLLLSDPVVKEIFDFMYRVYEKEGTVKPEEILENLDAEPTRERFREAVLSPSIYPEEGVEQALKEFEDRVQRIKLSESLMEKGGDLEEKNRILMLKRERQDQAS